MAGLTKQHHGGAVAAPAKRQPRWGDPGVSEMMIVQDNSIAVTPNLTQLSLQDSGILSEIGHHVYATDLNIVHGTGTNAKDVFGPYDIIQWYQFLMGGNTPTFSLSGKMLGVLQLLEYPGRSWEANPDPASVIDPLTNSTDLFSFPATATNGVFRFWVNVPLALRWAGMPGGAVGYVVLQNKKVSHVIRPQFNVSGAAPYSIATTSAVANNGAYAITGNDTVKATPTMEVWKMLHTVPTSRAQMPVFGFLRYVQEFSQPYSGTSFTYNLEPGGMLLRAVVSFFDATANRGVATANVNTIAYQYGTNKQAEVHTPQRNIQRQENLYGRYLPQGMYALDWYTAKRSLVDAKSTENTANVQIAVQFANTYTVPANSVSYILLDKVYVARTRVA